KLDPVVVAVLDRAELPALVGEDEAPPYPVVGVKHEPLRVAAQQPAPRTNDLRADRERGERYGNAAIGPDGKTTSPNLDLPPEGVRPAEPEPHVAMRGRRAVRPFEDERQRTRQIKLADRVRERAPGDDVDRVRGRSALGVLLVVRRVLAVVLGAVAAIT